MATDSISSIAGVVCTGIFIIVSILPIFLLSRLLKVEHDYFRDQWEKDGSPSGAPFWFPIGESHVLGFRSYPWFVGTWWLFKTPDWVKGHQPATKALRYYRLVSYFIYLGLSIVCLLMGLISLIKPM